MRWPELRGASDYHRHLTDEEVSYLEGFAGEGAAEPTLSEPTDFGLSSDEETAREVADVTVYRTFADVTSITRKTPFV